LAETEPFVTNLRERLRGLVVRADAKRCDAALPVPVDDSKRVFGRFGADGLARGVAAFASAMGTRPPANLRDLHIANDYQQQSRCLHDLLVITF